MLKDKVLTPFVDKTLDTYFTKDLQLLYHELLATATMEEKIEMMQLLQEMNIMFKDKEFTNTKTVLFAYLLCSNVLINYDLVTKDIDKQTTLIN